MKATMELEGAKEMSAMLKDLQNFVGKEIANVMVATGNLVAGDARKSVQRRSMGEAVTRYHRGRRPVFHIASRPGDAPNTDTGQLVNGITAVIKSDGVYVGVGRAGVRDYAGYLEFGTRKMRARPWLMPAMKGRQADFRKLLSAAIDDAVKDADRGR